MNKKTVAMLLSAAMASGMIATPVLADEVELTMYHSWGEEEQRGQALYNAVDQFNEQHKGEIKITVDVNNDFPAYQEKCKTMVSTGTAPDIFHYNFNPNDLSLQESGKLFDFTPYMDDEWKERFGEGDLDMVTVDGKLTSIPFEKAGAVWYYNTELFDKAGISSFPTTWDELLEDCEKLKGIGVAPFTLYTADDAWYTCNLFTYLAASYAGTDALNAGGSLNTDEMVKAATMLRKLMDYTTNDFIGANYSVASSNFVAEKTAIVIDGSWFIGTAEPIKDKVAIAQAPTFSDEVVKPGYLVTDAQTPWACGAQDDEAKADAIVTFMKYITSPEVIKQLTLDGGVFASEKFDITDEDREAAGPLKASYIDANLNSTGSVVNLQRNLSKQANALLPSLLESLKLDQITPEEFVQQLDDANNS